MSVSLPPATAAASPAHSDCSVTSMSSSSSGATSPTGTVMAESPCQPSTIAPQSREMMSPSRSRRRRDGMPCTTSSLIDAHMTAGKPR
jgi:hypothetical protein